MFFRHPLKHALNPGRGRGRGATNTGTGANRKVSRPDKGGFYRPHPRRSGEVEMIEVHNLVPRRHKVLHKLLPGILTPIEFRESPKL